MRCDPSPLRCLYAFLSFSQDLQITGDVPAIVTTAGVFAGAGSGGRFGISALTLLGDALIVDPDSGGITQPAIPCEAGGEWGSWGGG